eukprot:m.137720 g.137720  ORF g.137720 m.137720 type:complete len:153 (-) comp15900_c0_seq1:24-482(-)
MLDLTLSAAIPLVFTTRTTLCRRLTAYHAFWLFGKQRFKRINVISRCKRCGLFAKGLVAWMKHFLQLILGNGSPTLLASSQYMFTQFWHLSASWIANETNRKNKRQENSSAIRRQFTKQSSRMQQATLRKYIQDLSVNSIKEKVFDGLVDMW